MKKLLNLLLAAFGLFLGLLIAEIALRVVQPQPVEYIEDALYTSDPPPRYRLAPGYRGRISNGVEFDVSIAVNARGMRDEAVDRRKAGETRLLVLGDSFPFGWGVEAEETFGARLEDALRPQLPGIQVLNGGVPGYGPVDLADWLERYGVDLEPDLVLVTFFLGNDLIDATEKHRRIVVTDASGKKGDLADQQRDLLYQHSHLVRLFKRALPGAVRSRLRSWLGLPEPWATTYLRDVLESYAIDETALAAEGRESSSRALARMESLAREHDFELSIALLPGPLQIVDESWRRGLDRLGAEGSTHDPHRPAQIFTELAEKRAAPVIDLTPAFREASEPATLFFRYDPHWTPAGHALAAEKLRDFVLAAIDDSQTAGPVSDDR